MRHGKGKLWFLDGSTYEGDWEYNAMHGNGRQIDVKGNVYEGQFRNDMRHGRGTLQYINGDVYAGEWSGDVKEGQGIFQWASKGTSYDGAFSGGTMHGQGKYSFADGSVFEGQYVKGIRQGKGTLRLADGSKQYGEWCGLVRTASGRSLLKQQSAAPAVRPDLGLKRDQKKDYLEKMLQLEGFVKELEADAKKEASQRSSPTGDESTEDGLATPRQEHGNWFW